MAPTCLPPAGLPGRDIWCMREVSSHVRSVTEKRYARLAT
jgi:hypothetical protein